MAPYEFDDYDDLEAPEWEDTAEVLLEEYQRQTEALYRTPEAVPDDEGLITLPVVFLRGAVVYPRMLTPIFVDEELSVPAIEAARERGTTVLAFPLYDPDVVRPRKGDIFPIGVEAAAGRPLSLPDEQRSALMQGRRRVRLVRIVRWKPFVVAQAVPLPLQDAEDRETEALLRNALRLLQRMAELSSTVPEEAYLFALNIDSPDWAADFISTTLAPDWGRQLEVLSTLSPKERLRKVVDWLAQEVDVLELEDEIHHRVQSEMDRSQREAYLREQMRAIQSELGEGDFWQKELNELRQRIEKADLPEEPRKVALREWERLSQLPPMSPEVGIVRTYIDWILELPWTERTEDNLDLAHAREVLERNHYGLKRAKERILEFMAVLSLKPKRPRQPILCFVGPPGTGKTSLGRSIAEALGRKFVRVSLGGVRDEAEIRGHRRTYIGALPGRILQTMRRAGTVNPLFMLDEIDKLGADFRGDPAAALLEVLDPEQNHAFSDHYLEIPYNLSQVMFITTANTLSTIPPALLDRMEVIEFPGYVEEEKVQIAKRFLIPRQLEETGLEPEEVSFTESAIRRVIRRYTYEAGVRNLERELGRILRKIARLKAEGKRFPSKITPQVVERLLGPPQFFESEAEKEDEVGVATALAWTEAGGDVMPVEVLLMEGKGEIKITGQVGEIMQESAQAALSYLRARAKSFGLQAEVFEKTDIHIHIPEGSVPKDGPSAGVTIATALVSAFTGRKVRHEVGMTGEITLRGKVLPVGGVREKVLAAHRAGLKEVILPKRNLKDLMEVPRSVREALRIVPVTRLDEVLREALRSAPKEETT